MNRPSYGPDPCMSRMASVYLRCSAIRIQVRKRSGFSHICDRFTLRLEVVAAQARKELGQLDQMLAQHLPVFDVRHLQSFDLGEKRSVHGNKRTVEHDGDIVIDCNIARHECIVAVASKQVLTRGTRSKHKGGPLHLSKRLQRGHHGRVGDLDPPTCTRTEIEIESIRRNASSSSLALDITFSKVLRVRVLLRDRKRQRRRR